MLTVTNGPPLCRVDADWIIEAFEDADGEPKFPKMSDVWFEETVAKTVEGRTIGLNGAEMVNLVNSAGTLLCSATRYSDWDYFYAQSH